MEREMTAKEKIKEQEEAMRRIIQKQETAITGIPPIKKWPSWIIGIFIGFILGQLPFTGADTVQRPGENAAVDSASLTFLRLDGREAFTSIHSAGVFIGSDRIKTPMLQFVPITSVNAQDVLDYLGNGCVGLWNPGGGISSADLSPFDAQDIEALRAAIASRGGAAIVVKVGDKLRSAALTDLTGLSNEEAALHNVVFRWGGILYGANLRAI